MYPTKLSFMIQILLVFICKVQTSNADVSQRNLLRESFQKVLMNDSEQLLTLQQIFLTPPSPRQKSPNGFYLYVNVTVEGRINTESDSYHSYLIDEYCDNYNNYSCVYGTSMMFEVLPPAADQNFTVKKFLTEIDISTVLKVLDPIFTSLTTMFQSFYNKPDRQLTLYTHVHKVEILLDELPTDVSNALYLTLSWVS
jgi:hypothetical protein